MRNINGALKRSGIVLLTLIMIITCMPVFAAAPVYAANDTYEMEEIVTVDGVDPKAEKEKAEAAALAADGVTEPDADALDEQFEEDLDQNPQPVLPVVNSGFVMSDTPEAPLQKENDPNYLGLVPAYAEAGEDASKLKLQEEIYPDDWALNVQVDSEGIAHVSGYIVGDGLAFESVHLDTNELTGDSVYGQTEINGTIDMKNYDIGYHYLEVLILHNNVSTGKCLAVDKVKTSIYEKPSTFKTDNFTTKRTSIQYYNAGNYYSLDNNCEVYVDFKKKGGTWKTEKIHAAPYYSKSKGGFKAGSTYSARGYYCKKVQYWRDSKTYTFKGPKKTVKTLKTGYKKPKVKKVKISKVKQKVRKYRYWTGKIRQRWLVNARTGQRIRLIKQWKIYRTVRYYTTRYKVTVTFKKKQGVAGIELHTSHGYTVWLGGDKKKYSKTFTVSGKRKGKKVKISVKSRRSKKYDGWSGTYKKRLRVR